MPTTVTNLSDIATRSELAETLDVPLPALDVVALATRQCRHAGCALFATEHNFGYCVLHSQSWFPRELEIFGRPSANRRGYGLYGPQFLRNHTGKMVASCCCSSPLCEKLGYSHDGMFRFPKKPEQVAEAARVLGLSPADRQKIVNSPRRYRIAPWHYSARHRYRDNEGRWRLRKLENYKDADGKVFSFPPPNGNVQSFIDEQCLTIGLLRGEYDNTLPGWFRVLIRQHRAAGGRSPIPTLPSLRLSPRPSNVTPTPRRTLRKRVCPDAEEVSRLKDINRDLEARLASAMQHMQHTETIGAEDSGRLREENDLLTQEVNGLRSLVSKLEQRKVCLSYDDLQPGGALGAAVKDFTFFPDYDCNEAFLELLNFAEEGKPGLCEDLVRYSKVSVESRREYQLSADDQAAETLTQMHSGRRRKLYWKTEWLIYNFLRTLWHVHATHLHLVRCWPDTCA